TAPSRMRSTLRRSVTRPMSPVPIGPRPVVGAGVRDVVRRSGRAPRRAGELPRSPGRRAADDLRTSIVPHATGGRSGGRRGGRPAGPGGTGGRAGLGGGGATRRGARGAAPGGGPGGRAAPGRAPVSAVRAAPGRVPRFRPSGPLGGGCPGSGRPGRVRGGCRRTDGRRL